MILKKINDSFQLIQHQLNEEQFLSINPEYIYVKTLPDSLSGRYLLVDGEYIVDTDYEFEFIKKEKLEEISAAFGQLMLHGKLTSSLGFDVDNRRSDDKNDKDNVQSLIDLGIDNVNYKDANNNFHQLTINDLQTLKLEMIQDGLSKYQWKWTKEAEIEACLTIEELNGITI